MAMRIYRASLFLIALCAGLPYAYGLIGVCGGRHLPPDKIRKVRNIHLECSSNVDHFIRRPIPFDVNEWRKQEKLGKRAAMQEFRQKEALIIWKGSIPYETVEVWEWTDWVYGKDPVCGYDTKTVTDTDGKKREVREMRSCWHDEDQTEVRPCSTEVMKYSSQFIRPSQAQWNPKTPGYYDVIPNKYDLLPGEIEDVQIFNTGGRSSTLTPTAQVGDAWNEYGFQFNILGHGTRAACQYQHTYELDVRIETVARLINKATPNAFRMPVDRHSRPIDALSWEQGANSKGDTVRVKPRQLKLSDVSSTIITAMARQSRNFTTELEKAKQEAGVGASTSAEDTTEHEQASGFWKDTQVRIALFEVVSWGRDRRSVTNVYTSGSDVAMGEHYEIGLVGSSAQYNLYKASGPIWESFWNQFQFGLRPNTQYEVRVSMYQKGVPFYAQDCETRPGIDCYTPWGRLESSYYSKALPIPFSQKTDRYIDDRGWLQWLSDWQGRKFW